MICAVSVIYMAFMLPLGFAPDEAEHAYRAYQLSLGNLLPQVVSCLTHPNLLPCKFHFAGHLVPHRRVGGQVSAGLYHAFQTVTNLVTLPAPHGGTPEVSFNPAVYNAAAGAALSGPTLFAHFENTALYSPVNYLPQTLVFWVARTLSQPAIATLFAGRLVMGIVWGSLVTVAVALTPRWKWQFALAVLVPTELAQGATLSADAMSLALAAVTIAYALAVADRDGPITNWALARLAGLCLLLGLLKVPVPLVVAGVLVVVWPVLGSSLRERAPRLAVLALPGTAASVWWNLALGADFVPYRNTVFPPDVQAYISQSGQLHYLFTHIFDIPSILWETAIKGDLLNLNGLVGTVGQDGRSGPLPEWFALAWLAVFAVLVIAGGEGPGLPRRLRGLLAGSFVVYVLVTMLGLYLTATALGADHVNGIHGRYYTPLLGLALPLLGGLGGSRQRIGERAIAWTVMAVSLAAAITLFFHTSESFYHQAPWQSVPRVWGALF